jgi:hypothetical protein
MKPCHGAHCDLSQLIDERHSGRQLNLLQRNRALSALSGPNKSNFRGRGIDFEEVRSYQPGDDIRTIDWRVTARTGIAHTKVFREERERPIFIIADMRRPMLFGSQRLKAEIAVRIATVLGWAGLNANDRVGALVFGPQSHVEIKPRRSHHNVLKMIHSLHDLCREMLTATEDSYSANRIIEEVRRIAHPGSSIFIVSDFHDIDFHNTGFQNTGFQNTELPPNSGTQAHTHKEKSYEENLYELSQHCDVTLCHVYDDLEKKLPPPGLYPILDNGRQSFLNTRSSNLQNLCLAQFEQRTSNLKYLCSKLGLGYLSFSTNDEEIGKLAHAYGKRRGRKK